MAIEVFVRGPMSAPSVEQALKLLRRKLSREGIFLTLRDHATYAKPSVKRKRKIGRAESRRRKARSRYQKLTQGRDA